jgi:predicted nucleic acid-binding protein
LSAASPAEGVLVIDASLFVQIFVEEPRTQNVVRYLADQHRTDRFVGPSILVSETAAAITKKLRRREIGPQAAREAFANLQQALSSGSFELFPTNDFLSPAFEFSIKLHHPLHDCLYLAVAAIHRARLVTVDEKLADKARTVGIHAHLIEP